jgi:hypothetical protein
MLSRPQSHSAALFSGYRFYFPGVNQPGREGDHLSPSNAKIKYEWSYVSVPLKRLNGLDVGNFTFPQNIIRGKEINVT